MNDLVSEYDLDRTRRDPEFRQQLLADNLERLLQALNDMRKVPDNDSSDAKRQIREGVDLAVKLAERLQRDNRGGDPRAA